MVVQKRDVESQEPNRRPVETFLRVDALLFGIGDESSSYPPQTGSVFEWQHKPFRLPNSSKEKASRSSMLSLFREEMIEEIG